MKDSIEAMLWDFIVDNNIATEDEVRLVSDINGWNEETMTDIILCQDRTPQLRAVQGRRLCRHR